MKFSTIRARLITLSVVFLAVLLLFSMRLMQMQVVEGKEYEAQIQKGAQKVQTVEAARGEIVDRYGRPFAVNRVSFDIVLDRAFLPDGEENESILALVRTLQGDNQLWIDNLPISQSEPYTFLPDRERDVAKLKKYVNVGDYANAEYVMHWLSELYGLQDYPPAEARILAGIRYEMAQRDFSYTTPYILARDVAVTTATKIKEHGFEMPGVDVSQSATREYPSGTLAPHVIGVTGPIYAEELESLGEDYRLDDMVGKSGIEKLMEENLRGTAGERIVFINPNGEVVEVVGTRDPIPGNTVSLTLDKNLQKVAQDSLEAQIRYLQQTAPAGQGREAFAGAAVAIDVKTGEVLCMATYPSYDLGSYYTDYSTLAADSVGTPLLNRALQGTYTPGSIFKPVTALSGLASGVITGADSTVFCGHVYTFFQDYQPGCLGSHGNINVITALQRSCNIFFYDVGRRSGIESIDKYAAAMGLGEETGIELPSALGQVSSPEFSESHGQDWVPGDVIQTAIGQKDNKFTPLQLANYAATIANRGTRMKVSIIKSIKSYDYEETILEHQPQVANQLEEDPAIFDLIIEGMRACAQVPGGSAYSYFGDYPISVAAKTGTPETREFPNSTFICFAPIEDPQIAVAVVIEKGWHGYTGAPVARAIFDEYFASRLSTIQPQEPGVLLP